MTRKVSHVLEEIEQRRESASQISIESEAIKYSNLETEIKDWLILMNSVDIM